MQYIKLEYLLKRKGSATRLAERSGVPQSHLTRWKQAGALVEASTGVVYLPSATAHRLQLDEVMELAIGAPCGMAQKNSRDVQYTSNIADSLADALDALLSMLESEGRQDEKIFKDCEQVSNAYWGVK
jgi:ribosomal 50S subunit-associated protein YjgA (DUF615 family)